MSKHTPGPWKVDAMGNVWSADTKVCEMSEHPVIASGCYREKTDDEHRANARLIAAAPELLEALRDCVKWYGNRTNDDFRNDDSLRPIDQQPPEIQRAMRAIAKAKAAA